MGIFAIVSLIRYTTALPEEHHDTRPELDGVDFLATNVTISVLAPAFCLLAGWLYTLFL